MFVLANELRSAFYSVETESERDELINRGFIDITEEKSAENKKTSTKRGKKNVEIEN